MRFLLLGLLTCSGLWAALPAKPIGHINDEARLYSQGYVAKMEQHLREISNDQGPEIAIVTLNTLGSESVETAARKIFDSWGIGKRGEDNGILLLIAMKERKIRIETGYGLEGKLPDSVCGRIIRDKLSPQLKDKRYEAGTSAAIDAITGRVYNGDVKAFNYVSDLVSKIFIVVSLLALMIIEIYFRKVKKRSFFSNSGRHHGGYWGGGSSGRGGFGGFGGGRGGGGGASGGF